jgi:hypothetical protein
MLDSMWSSLVLVSCLSLVNISILGQLILIMSLTVIIAITMKLLSPIGRD